MKCLNIYAYIYVYNIYLHNFRMLWMEIIHAFIERAWFLADLPHSLYCMCSINTHSSVLGGIYVYVLIMRKEAHLRPL